MSSSSSSLSTRLAPGASVQGAEQLRSLRTAQKHLLRMPTLWLGEETNLTGFYLMIGVSGKTFTFEHCIAGKVGAVPCPNMLVLFLSKICITNVYFTISLQL